MRVQQSSFFSVAYKFMLSCMLGALLCFSQAANASYGLSAGDLRDDCKVLLDYLNSGQEADPKSLDSGICMGYIDGFNDMHANMAFIVSGGTRDLKAVEQNMIYCIPESVTNKNIVEDIISYVDKNPNEAKMPAGTIVLVLLQEKYPCTDKGKPEDKQKPSAASLIKAWDKYEGIAKDAFKKK